NLPWFWRLAQRPMPRASSRLGNIFAKPDRTDSLRARARTAVCFRRPCIPLKISHDLRIGVRDFHPVELDFAHPPVQLIRGVRPFAGENGEIGSAHAHVAGDAFHLGRTATVEVRHRPAAAAPASPPMRKPTSKAGPFICLSRARHSNLHANSSVALLRV